MLSALHHTVYPPLVGIVNVVMQCQHSAPLATVPQDQCLLYSLTVCECAPAGETRESMCRRAILAAAAGLEEALPGYHASAAGGICSILHAHHSGFCELVWGAPGVF